MITNIRTAFHAMLYRDGRCAIRFEALLTPPSPSRRPDQPCACARAYAPHPLGSNAGDDESMAIPATANSVLSCALLETAITHFIMAGGANPDGLAAALETCISLRVPLTELLDDDSDGTAPNRLMQLLQPAWAAEWVVTASPSDVIDDSDGDGGDSRGPSPGACRFSLLSFPPRFLYRLI